MVTYLKPTTKIIYYLFNNFMFMFFVEVCENPAYI